MSRTAKPRRSVEDVADRLHSAAIHVLRLVRVQDAATGVAPARLSALSVIVFAGPISLKDLARAEQVRPPTMSRIVDALESAGFARRTTNPEDRRAVTIAATPKGAAILQQGRKRRVQTLAQVVTGLTAKELKELEHGLSVLQCALQNTQWRKASAKNA
jgi:DNA-binding MarR family transcriptional regulator